MESDLQKVLNTSPTNGKEKGKVGAEVPAQGQMETTMPEWDDDIIEMMDTEEIHVISSDMEEKQEYDFRKPLISLIRKKPILYDPKHPDFSVKRLKNVAWQSIAKKLKVDTDTCQNTWAELRCKYQRYARRLRLFIYNAERSRHQATSVKRRDLQRRRRPSMRYEVEMMFLYRFIRPKSRVSLEKDVETDINTTSIALVNTIDDDVVLLNYTEPNVIDLDGEEFRLLPYKFTNQARTLAATVRAYPELYDTNHRNFRSYRRRGIIWSAIAAELKDKGTKLMKFWMQLLVRYEWEVCVGYVAYGGVLLKPSKLQEMMSYLRPYIVENPNTVFKQSHYLKKDWFDPLDHFKTVVSLLDTLKQNPQLIQLTDDTLTLKTKPPAYDRLWKKVAAAISCSPEQCEITWLVLRSFYWELVELRLEGYYLQDKWYFENVIGNLYKTVKETSQLLVPPLLTPATKITTIAAQSTTKTTALDIPISMPTLAIQNSPLQTSTSLNAPTVSEFRMPKIVGAMSLASIYQNTTPVTTAPLFQLQTGAHPAMPTLVQPKRFAKLTAATTKPVPILPKPCIRPSHASVTVSLRSSRPNNSYPVGTVFGPLLFSSGATTSQNFFVRPVSMPTTTPLPSTSVNNNEQNKGQATGPLRLNLIQPPPPPIMSVRPQTHVLPVTECQQPRSLRIPPTNVTLAQHQTTPNTYNAILKSDATIKANIKPSVTTKASPWTATATALNSKSVNSPPEIDLTAVISPASISACHSIPDASLMDSNSWPSSTTASTRIPTSTPTAISSTQLASLLNPNQIMIELISNNKDKLLVVYGPALTSKYALSMAKTAYFIREVMAIPLLHNKQTNRIAQVNEYWQHISKQFELPVHICKACWNFLADNVAHFPQIAPMVELMRPFKSPLKVWFKSHKLFRSFNAASMKKGWLKQMDELPKLLKFLEPYTFLYEDVRRNKPGGQPTTEQPNAEDKMSVWKKARERFPNIAHPVEIWLAFKLVFVRYMIELEDAYENPWPQSWWPALGQLMYLIGARYDRMDPFYYIVLNKFAEELTRCRMNDKILTKKPSKQLADLRAIRDPTSMPTTLPSSPTSTSTSLRQLIISGGRIDAYEMTRLICKLPAIYKKSSLLAQRAAWLKLAGQLNMTVRECRLTLQFVLRGYLEFKASDKGNRCRLNRKYYKHFAYIFRIVRTRIRNDRSRCTLIELLLQNEPPEVMQPRSFIPDINMHNCSVPLVMKNWAHAASHLTNDRLYIKMKSLFEKYQTANLQTRSQ